MQNFRNPFERSLAPEKKYTLPVKALSEKLKTSQPGKSSQYFVKCVSHMPLASDTTKEEIRLNYLHGVIQGRVNDTRLSKSVVQPHLQMGLSGSIPITMPPTQTTSNPFTKPSTFPQPQNLSSFSSSHSTIPNGPKNNNPIPLSNNNPFVLKQNQLLGNNCSNQPKHFTTMSEITISPGLVRQPSFGMELNTSFGKSTSVFGNTQAQQGPQQGGQPGQRIFGIQSTANVGFTVTNTSSNQLGGNTNLQAPGQLTSFATTSQSGQLPTGTFGQPQQNLQVSSKPTDTMLISHRVPLQLNPTATTITAPNSQSYPYSNPQNPTTALDQNIKQLLDSKPNLWNILALDPQYQHGFNQSGRMYVKSVLQRIIDQNILSEQSLNKVIVEIYKQMYGAENFEKILQSKKNEMLDNDKISNWRMSELLGKEFSKNMTESVFPKDIDSIGEDFYRSFKRRSTKFFDEPFISVKKDDEYEKRLERKFYNIKRASKPVELKVKFVEMNRPQERAKIIDNPYTPQGLEKISEAITEIRNVHRRQIMPKQEELPNVEGFTISPPLKQIRTFTRYQLLSVPKVTISNEWGSIRFKTPISLLNKNLAENLMINQRSVQIIDQEWKVRDAQITFKKFADFSQLDQQEQDALQDKIEAWCEKEKFDLVKIDKVKGQVMIQV